MQQQSLKVRTRLIIGFGSVLFMMIIVISIGNLKLNNIVSITKNIVEQEWVKEQAINTVNATTRSNARYTMQLLITQDKQQIDDIFKTIKSNKKIIDEALAVLDKGIEDDESRAAFNSLKEKRINYVNSFSKVGKLLLEDKREAAIKLMLLETLPTLDSLQNSIVSLVNLQKSAVERSGVQVQNSASTASQIMLTLAIITLIIGLGAAYRISYKLLKQLGGEPEYAVSIAEQIAEGNLAISIKTKNGDASSLLNSMKKMQQQLRLAVGKIRESTDSIGTASREIASGNLDLSKRTESQAASLQETASSMEQLTSTVKHNADNAQQANQFALTAQSVAEKGGKVVKEVVNTMASINESSKKIVDIIGVIDGIAFQTNILALNAAVEAARAGEQGRGFAVVATEVRTLAQRSAAAAKEIKALISDSVNKVDTGAKLVDETGLTMNEIVESVKRVTNIMAQITAASQDQTTDIEQVNQAVGLIDDVTQQNAALVEQAAAAAESLQDQAQQLAKIVATFQLEDDSVNRSGAYEQLASDHILTSSHTKPVAERRSSHRPFTQPRQVNNKITSAQNQERVKLQP